MAIGLPVSKKQTIEKPKVTCAIATLQDCKQTITAQASIPKNYDQKKYTEVSYLNIHQDIKLPDVFAYLHIKVPERILHQQFLI